MSKELSPLEALNILKNISIYELDMWTDSKDYKGECFEIYKDEINIIETALKDYEKKTKLAKEYDDVDNVAKRLKALEIIKEKGIIKDCFVGVSLEDYNSSVDFNNTHLHHSYKYLTQEEFNLLKEVLK